VLRPHSRLDSLAGGRVLRLFCSPRSAHLVSLTRGAAGCRKTAKRQESARPHSCRPCGRLHALIAHHVEVERVTALGEGAHYVESLPEQAQFRTPRRAPTMTLGRGYWPLGRRQSRRRGAGNALTEGCRKPWPRSSLEGRPAHPLAVSEARARANRITIIFCILCDLRIPILEALSLKISTAEKTPNSLEARCNCFLTIGGLAK